MLLMSERRVGDKKNERILMSSLDQIMKAHKCFVSCHKNMLNGISCVVLWRSFVRVIIKWFVNYMKKMADSRGRQLSTRKSKFLYFFHFICDSEFNSDDIKCVGELEKKMSIVSKCRIFICCRLSSIATSSSDPDWRCSFSTHPRSFIESNYVALWTFLLSHFSLFVH